MKKKEYYIAFANGKIIFVSVFNQTEAEILAKAEMIKQGNSYKIIKCKEISDDNRIYLAPSVDYYVS